MVLNVEYKIEKNCLNYPKKKSTRPHIWRLTVARDAVRASRSTRRHMAMFTWGPQAIMFINIRIEIRRNDRLSAAQ